ncbi:MAG: type II secretion system F family protein [Gemmatales bacterium]|nr:type II secretion system F family protein [Gemmatales bacterium]MDW7995116.1 type II secretion system F family protein [Gemmatales bacterium]
MIEITADILVLVCRHLRHLLEAGLAVSQAWQQLALKGPKRFRPLARSVADRIKQGESLESALQPWTSRLPAFFTAAITIGERTGRLPEVLHELEQAFELQLELRRQFWSRISWPLLQFIAAVLVLALFIWLLGVIESVAGRSPISLFGLKGEGGALIFLIATAALTLGPYLVLRYFFARGQHSVAVHRALLQLPVIGGALQALAEARFAQALAVALDAGLVVHEAAELALSATGNPAFADWAARVRKQTRRGQPLSEALTATGLLTHDFLTVLSVAEAAGSEPDALRRHAQHRYQQAADQLRLCTNIAAGAVWLLVAMLIATLIVRLFTQYVETINLFLDSPL